MVSVEKPFSKKKKKKYSLPIKDILSELTHITGEEQLVLPRT